MQGIFKIIIALSALISAHAFAAQNSTCRNVLKPPTTFKSQDQHWAESGLNLQTIENYLEFSGCKNKSNWLECMTFLNGLVSDGKPKRLLLPKAIRSSYESDIESTEKDYGALQLVRLKSKLEAGKRDSIEEVDLREVRRKKEYNAAIEALDRKSVDFEKIRGDLFELVEASGREAAQVAFAFNQSLMLKDPHSYLRPASDIKEVSNSKGVQQFVGVGMRLRGQGNQVVIGQVLPESAAAEGGLHSDDELLAIDGESVENIPYDAVTFRLRGEAGSRVELTVKRNNKTYRVSLVRKTIQVKNVSQLLVDNSTGTVGVVKLTSFDSPDSCTQVRIAVKDLEKNGAKGLILDLRGNGGGLLHQAVCIAGLFLGKGQLVASVESLLLHTYEHHYTDVTKITDLPLVVLVDGQSASASEFLSGALRDHHRAWVLGEVGYGKGNVQSASGLDNYDLDAAKIWIFRTTGRFYQPSGSSNQLVGIQPNFIVYRTPDEKEQFVMREGDMYANAIPGSRKQWSEDRVEEVSVLKECLNKEGSAVRKWRESKRQGAESDFQLLSAIDLLNCQY